MTVKGAAQLATSFKRIAQAVEMLVRDAEEPAAEPILQRAQDKAPVGTGRLRASLKNNEGNVVTDKAIAPYAPFVEYGTNDTPPQPFMRPAYDSGGPEVLRVYRNILPRQIERAAQRHGSG